MGSIFDKRKVLHGLPLPGQKVKYVKPSTWGFFTDVLKYEKELLEVGKEYTVKKTELNSSSTYVFLEEFWDDTIDEYFQNQKFFNMWAFEWNLPELNLDDLIGLDVRSVCAMGNKTYKFGVKFDDQVFCLGTPMLVLEYDQNQCVTKAYYENY